MSAPAASTTSNIEGKDDSPTSPFSAGGPEKAAMSEADEKRESFRVIPVKITRPWQPDLSKCRICGE